MSRAAILAAASEVLAEGGVGALTMRALARRLQVAPNALYSHVPDKAALLDLLLDELLASVPAPAADAEDPVAALKALMTTTYDVLTAHPALVPLYLARQGARGPHAIRLGKVMDALLARAGAIPDDAVAARRVLIIHTIGSAAFAAGPPGGPDDPERLDADRPLSRQQSRHTFTRSLHWLVTGIVRQTSDAPAGGGPGAR